VMADEAEAAGAAMGAAGDFSHYISSPAPPARNALATPPSSKHSGRPGGKRARDPMEKGTGETMVGNVEDGATRRHISDALDHAACGSDVLVEASRNGMRPAFALASSGGMHGNGGEGGGDGCGEGLSALISHLTAQRQPQVQAWLRLKDDLMKADEALMFAEGWDDLNDLEADFHQINAQHLTNKSWLVA